MTYVYYYSKLKKDEQNSYIKILTALRNHNKKCVFEKKHDSNVVEKIINCVILDNPILGYYSAYIMTTVDSKVINIEFTYYLTKNKQEQLVQEMLNQANKIVSYARTQLERRDRIKLVYNYFAKQQYDYDFKSYSFNPSGSLLYGKTVCMGIALAFKLIMDMLDIPSICVVGEHDGDGHAWNKVYYDFSWHLMDVTFDMCATIDEQVSYRYFDFVEGLEKYQSWVAFPIPN